MALCPATCWRGKERPSLGERWSFPSCFHQLTWFSASSGRPRREPGSGKAAQITQYLAEVGGGVCEEVPSGSRENSSSVVFTSELKAIVYSIHHNNQQKIIVFDINFATRWRLSNTSTFRQKYPECFEHVNVFAGVFYFTLRLEDFTSSERMIKFGQFGRCRGNVWWTVV